MKIAYPAPHLIHVVNYYVEQTPFPAAFVLELAINVVAQKPVNPLEWIDEYLNDELLNYYLNPNNGMVTESIADELKNNGDYNSERLYSQILHEVSCSSRIVYELSNHLDFLLNVSVGLNELLNKRTLLRCNLINGILFMEFDACHDLPAQPL